jgi:hypothetical protein
MTDENVVKSISASPQKPQWYHWVYTFLISAMVLTTALGGFFVAFMQHESSVSKFKIVALFFFACSVWYYSVFAILRKKAIATYDNTHLRSFQGPNLYLLEPVLLSAFPRALRRSEYSIELSLNATMAESLRMRSAQHAPLEILRLEGNEKDLDAFSATLAKNGCVVDANPIPDDDPLKENTVLGLSIVLIVLGIVGALLVAIKLAAK